MKPILLLDESLHVEIYYESEDGDYEDNICIKVIESCPDEEKVFVHDESHLYLTLEQAQELLQSLEKAIQKRNLAKENDT